MAPIRYVESTPIGYAALVKMFSIKAMPHYRNSYILESGTPYSEKEGIIENHYYSRKYFPKDLQNPLNHLEFAMKHEGVNLEILLGVFKALEAKSLEGYIRDQPTGKQARRLWYLYEFLTGKLLDLQDATYGGSYSLLLNPKEYYTGASIRSRRHYIDDNLLGNRFFCPSVRRTADLEEFEKKDFSSISSEMIEKYEPKIITRAVNFLYSKETMSSYEIEKEKPDASRAARFTESLKKADHMGSLQKEALIELQNIIVDSRYANTDYRDFQNYIGTQARLDSYSVQIDYLCPKFEDIKELIKGLLASLERMISSKVHPVIIAASISFGFVFIHPFEDGNGRIHRFLMHYIFARTGFVPKGSIFPVSAVILKNIAVYDSLLESFSKPLLTLLQGAFEFDRQGNLQIHGETDSYYRYIDYTKFASYLFACVEKTIQVDFEEEILYLINYDAAKKALQAVIDMPDNKIDLFIQLVLQNQGVLSARKRESLFSKLNEEEVLLMQNIVQKHML